MQTPLFPGDAPPIRPGLPKSTVLRHPLAALIHEVDNDWALLLRAWSQTLEGQRLIAWVDARVASGAAVYPGDVFRALRDTSCQATRLVILGQDPYHGVGQAEGLAFSVPQGQPIPPSLRNIFKEIRRSHPAWPEPSCGHLGSWARSGVLLLNTILTVEEGQPGSHAQCGWESLTDQIIKLLADGPPKVFMLWGVHAQSKAPQIESRYPQTKHLILRSHHPSPLSAWRPPTPFIGCGHFEAAQSFLSRQGPLPWEWPAL